MDIIYNPGVLTHKTAYHPESPDRLTSFGELPITLLSLNESLLSLIHTKEYIEDVKRKCEKCEMLDPDTQTSTGSFSAALFAVAATVRASETDNFALVRPPGHHAFPNHGAGFCLFNNIAIAVQKLVSQGKRICILDIDGHLGDGTEKIFYENNSVLYWSLHQEHAYPDKGQIFEIGENEGKGYTINVPLPPKSGDDIYLQAIDRLLPAIIEFNPDIVAVSAGFDAHFGDPMLHLNLSSTVYYQIGTRLRIHFPHIFATLEGGYNTDYLSKCVYTFIDGINGAPIRFREEPTETPFLMLEQFQTHLDSLVDILKPFWKTLV